MSKPRLTKELFCSYINFIQDQESRQDKLCDALENMSNGGYCNFFCYSDYKQRLIELLKIAMDMDPEDDIIEYFIYDLEYGVKGKECIQEKDGCLRDLLNSNMVYDYIVEEQEKKDENDEK